MQRTPTRESQFSIPAVPKHKDRAARAGPNGPSSSAVPQSFQRRPSSFRLRPYPRTRVMLRSIVSLGT